MDFLQYLHAILFEFFFAKFFFLFNCLYFGMCLSLFYSQTDMLVESILGEMDVIGTFPVCT